MYDDVFKEEEYEDEPFDDVEPEDGYISMHSHDDDILLTEDDLAYDGFDD